VALRHGVWAGLLGAVLVMAGCRPAADPGRNEAPPPAQAADFPLHAEDYPWRRTAARYEPLVARFPAPEGFSRDELPDGGWGQWLRHLPLKPPGTAVVTRTGLPIMRANSPSLAAVVDIEVRRNQECADVILRLRAEYLRHAGREDEIVLNLTGRGKIPWPEWQKGMRPRLEGTELEFHKRAPPDSSRASFDKYLASVFEWCGTLSLAQDGKPVTFEQLQVGDFFVHGGSPGHAVLVADLARDDQGNVRALLLQGYMPAQSMHILAAGGGRPWFDLDPAQAVDTPTWGEFSWSELRRFIEKAR